MLWHPVFEVPGNAGGMGRRSQSVRLDECRRPQRRKPVNARFRMPTKRVVVVEPTASGHHMALYVRHVVRALLEEGCKVTLVTTRDVVAHPSFQLLKAECPDEIDLYYLPDIPSSSALSAFSLFVSQLKHWTMLRNEFANIAITSRPDVVYIPTMDWIVKAIEVLGSPFGDIPFVGLYVAPVHHRKAVGLGPAGRQDWLYDRLFRRLLRIPHLQNLLVINEMFFEFCQERYGLAAAKVRYVPDFGEIRGVGTRADCRAALGISDKARVLLVYGSLTSRKGIVQLLDALAHPTAPRELIVILAGVASEEIRTVLEAPFVKNMRDKHQVVARLFFHDDADEYLVFRAADFVWLGYSKGSYGSSGVLCQAVSAGLPVVAMEQGLIGHLVRTHRLGATVNPHEGASIVAGLRKVLEIESSEHRKKATVQSFAARHNSASHAEAVLSALLDRECKE